MLVPVTALYAAALAGIAIVLTQLVGQARFKSKVSLNDGGNSQLGLAIRRHANFAEHVPLALVLLALIERNGAAPWVLHALGAPLVASRLIHPFGLDELVMLEPARFVGAMGTVLVTLAAAGIAAWQGFAGA